MQEDWEWVWAGAGQGDGLGHTAALPHHPKVQGAATILTLDLHLDQESVFVPDTQGSYILTLRWNNTKYKVYRLSLKLT